MSNFLRQSTASQQHIIGPFIDDVDFITPKIALTIANTDVKLMKNGAVSVNKNSGGGTHRINGDYAFTFNATDTDTIGELEVSILVVGAMLVKRTYVVVDAIVYDALYSVSPTLLTVEDVRLLYRSTIGVATSNTQFDMTKAIISDNVWVGQACTIQNNTTKEMWETWIVSVDALNDRLVTEPSPNGTDTIPFTVSVGDTVRVHGGMHPMFAIETFSPAVAGTPMALVANAVDEPSVAAGAFTTAKFVASFLTSALIATDAIGSPQLAVGAITSSQIAANAIGVSQIAAGAITSTKFAAGAITAAALATDAVTEIAQGTWAHVLGTTTFSAAALLQIIAGVASGKISGAATSTLTIRNIEDSNNVIVATVDASGNRSAIVIVTPVD